jgi:rhamnosyltransferase
VERALTERTGVSALPGSSPPKVSVVIPTLNAGPGFRDLLDKLSTQETSFGYEVLVVDSGSTDATAERRSLATFDNVSSCVRRSVWESIPFEPTGFGEDVRWGKRVVETGYKLVYEPRSAVLHSHERGALYDLRRHYVEGQLLLELFGLAPTPNLALWLLNVLRSTAHLYLRLRRDAKATGGELRLALLAAKHAVCSQTGLYLALKKRRLPARLDLLLRRGV